MDSKRLYYLDWLRFFVVLTLVPFHSALTFTGAGDAYVYLPQVIPFYLGHTNSAPIAAPGLRLFTDFFDDFFMHLLFCIAGMSAYFSIRNRNGSGYIKERLKKLLLPLLVNILLFIPVLSYFRNQSLYQFSGNFLEFYPLFFNGIRGSFSGANFEWAHLWFMAYLFVFSLFCLPWMKRVLPIEDLSKGFINFFSPIFIIILIGGELALRPAWPGFQNLVNDWANFSTYTLYFSLGFLISKNEILFDDLRRNYGLSLIFGTLLFLLKILFQELSDFQWGYNLHGLVYVALRTASGFLLCMGILGLGEAKLNRKHPWNKTVRRWSFPFYILHYLALSSVNILLVRLNWHYSLLFLVSLLLSFPLLYLLYRLIDQLPLLRVAIGASAFKRTRQ